MPYANSFEFSSDSKKLLIGVNYTVRVWDVATGKVMTPYVRHPSILNYLDGYNSTAAFSKDGKFIITREFGSYKIWDASNGEPMSALVEYNPDDEGAASKTNTIKKSVSIKGMSLENLRLYTALLAGQELDLNSGFVDLSGDSFMKKWVLWMKSNE